VKTEMYKKGKVCYFAEFEKKKGGGEYKWHLKCLHDLCGYRIFFPNK
jgi:hypothetical protein